MFLLEIVADCMQRVNCYLEHIKMLPLAAIHLHGKEIYKRA